MAQSTFVPKDYEVTTGGGDFFKMKTGDNRFRILSDALVGKLGWKDNMPFRRTGSFAEISPKEVDEDSKTGKPKIQDFMAMYIYSYADEKVMIAEFTQAGIKKAIVDLAQDANWGHPEAFDLTINKQGEGFNTKYTIKPSPAKLLTKAIQAQVDEAKPDFDLATALKAEEA